MTRPSLRSSSNYSTSKAGLEAVPQLGKQRTNNVARRRPKAPTPSSCRQASCRCRRSVSSTSSAATRCCAVLPCCASVETLTSSSDSLHLGGMHMAHFIHAAGVIWRLHSSMAGMHYEMATSGQGQGVRAQSYKVGEGRASSPLSLKPAPGEASCHPWSI